MLTIFSIPLETHACVSWSFRLDSGEPVNLRTAVKEPKGRIDLGTLVTFYSRPRNTRGLGAYPPLCMAGRESW